MVRSGVAGRNRARRASRVAVALLGTTGLTALPGVAFAQAAPAASPSASATAPTRAPAKTPARTPAARTPAAAAAPAPEAQGPTIQTIRVTGAERLEPQTVLSYVKLRAGQTYTSAAADQALKDLYETELFSDVQVTQDAGIVTIQVKENPVVNRIILEGNKRIKDEKILPEIKVAARQIFTRSKVRADVARIIELYKRQGRYAATVEPKMVMLDQNRVDIVFEITEGDKSKVRQINIIGNDKFSDGELRGEMVTKTTGLTKIFSSTTSYDPDRMAFDQQKLRQFYLTQGYADFRVVSAVAELTPDKKDFIITYVVEEGQRYKFGEVKVDSQLRDFDSEKLAARLPMKQGDWYNAKLVEDTIEQLNDTAGAFGYAFADVRPNYDRNKEDLTMGLTFVIAEAPRVYVERIDVNGNTLTQDKVVRREFRLAEGDAFNSLQVKRSTNRIKSLGYFQEKFEVEQKPGASEDRIILEANVEEKPTGELQLSAGFSSLESFIFQASIRQRNFRGRGQTVGLSGSYSRFSKSVEASFTEPYVFDKNVSLGVNVYRRDLNSFNYNNNDRDTTYKQTTTGFQVRAGVPLTEYLTAVASYTLNYDDVSLDEGTFYSDRLNPPNRTCDPLLAGRYLCDAIGKRLSSIVGLSLIYDTLDNRVRPTRGITAAINGDVAGLGGDVKYARLRANASKFTNLGKGFIFSLSAEGGAIKSLNGDDIRINDRFYLGEPQIGGFDIRGVGPRVLRKPYVDADGNVLSRAAIVAPAIDPATGQPGTDVLSTRRRDWTDDALGGRYYYLAKAELEIPLGSGARELGLRPSLFVNAGSVFGTRNPLRNQAQTDFRDTQTIPQLDSSGNRQFIQTCGTTQTVVSGNGTAAPAPSAGCTIGADAIGQTIFPFQESYVGDTWKPRVSVGIGVNWNSPFGPFRINFSKVLVKQDGDDTKPFNFNVGTQF
ncbi:outer membrane protein insertion porin family [Novosphingobium chloroacetimidivorans]|uniref:Outer membrane protein assembly factor BamA n=1 Tax=Novosphingobium chloroacetimidivorans TaxID=1428314 RepID=A0A7W7NWX2_9SPHN|nr:outer membrane protein assembly factor BamA [Novosphingobium chloroacetimidivorans]MBB4858547.1 outer membrane protein insertion porin family [Novosphingobium chloroacetimidivorans]